MGCTYDLTLFNGDSLYGDQQNPHEMNAHPEIGMPDVSLFPQGESHTVLTIPTGTAFDVPFACKNGSCANGGPPETTHETMLGIVHVVP